MNATFNGSCNWAKNMSIDFNMSKCEHFGFCSTLQSFQRLSVTDQVFLEPTVPRFSSRQLLEWFAVQGCPEPWTAWALAHRMRSYSCELHSMLQEYSISYADLHRLTVQSHRFSTICYAHSHSRHCDVSDLQWSQASLPIKDGGLGLRCDLARIYRLLGFCGEYSAAPGTTSCLALAVAPPLKPGITARLCVSVLLQIHQTGC